MERILGRSQHNIIFVNIIAYCSSLLCMYTHCFIILSFFTRNNDDHMLPVPVGCFNISQMFCTIT